MPTFGGRVYNEKEHRAWLEKQRAKIRLRYPNISKFELERVMKKKGIRY